MIDFSHFQLVVIYFTGDGRFFGRHLAGGRTLRLAVLFASVEILSGLLVS